MKKIGISTECVCDLPLSLLQDRYIDLIYFDIVTDKGVFQDTKEITANNVLEYMSNGVNKAQSSEPSPEQYAQYFENLLKEYVDVIHICITSKNAGAYKRATLGKKMMAHKGEHVHIVDSQNLSSGLGLVVLKAAELRDKKLSCDELIAELDKWIPMVTLSFIAKSTDYLYYNERISKSVNDFCTKMHVHPIIAVKNGKMTLSGIRVGNYEKACRRYIKACILRATRVDKSLGIITYSGCNKERLNKVEGLVKKRINFDEVIIHPASATVSCNCGPDSFGIIYFKQGKE